MSRRLAMFVVLALSACSSSRSTDGAREVNLAEFARPVAEAPPSATAEAADTADQRTVVVSIGPDDADAPPSVEDVDPGGATARDPASAPAASPAARPPARGDGTERLIVESLVGQVNGRPIYAADFFEDIEDELRAIAQRTGSTRAFRVEAANVVRATLSGKVLDALFLAEAESSLTPQQRQGLFGFVRSLREGVIGREGGGTRAQAEQSLREAEGVGVEEFVAAEMDQQLLRFLFQQEIDSRVIVSWRDVEREYERRRSEFQPPAVARLSRIRLDTQRDAERIQTVSQRLDAGAPFAEVADSVGMTDGGAWQQFELGDEGLAGIDLREEIRDRIADLEPGQASERFELGRSTWWLHVDAIEQPEGRSLYDPVVQRGLTAELRTQRWQEERDRYIATLVSDTIYEELREMGERLVELAVQRYGP